MKQISLSDLDALTRSASESPRRRANLNLHDTLDDPIQRLLIAMEPSTVVHSHRHPHTWELLMPVRGRFVVLQLDDTGAVLRRTMLGEDITLLETPPGQWHAVCSIDPGSIILEVKQGPYAPLADPDVHRWIKEDDSSEVSRLLDWYRTARPGDRFACHTPMGGAHR